MHKVKLTTIGNSVGFVVPKEVLGRMNAQKGDSLFLVDSPDGFLLTPYRLDFAEQIKAAEKVMKKYRNALRELAK